MIFSFFHRNLSALMKKHDELRAEKKVVGEKLSVVIKKFEKVKAELEELNEDYTKIKLVKYLTNNVSPGFTFSNFILKGTH